MATESDPSTPLGLTSSSYPLSSPNSMTSTNTNPSRISKKRPKSSWTEAHMIKINQDGETRRRCSHCHVCWSSTTSTGTIARHLTEKHHVINGVAQISNITPIMFQSSLESIKVPRASEKKIDSAITKYIVKGTLPHAHVESSEFKELMEVCVPGYELKSSRTLKRNILQMYVVLRQKVIHMLSKTASRFSITFDGWANNNLKGFYSVTLHWACHETARSKSMLLDFFNIYPGEGVGKRCGQALFNRLASFGISHRLMATISDGASDAQTSVKELATLLHNHHGKEILPPSHMLRCMVHTFQLGIKSALEVISPSTEKLRNVLVSLRSSKVRRAVFRKKSKMVCYIEKEPPSIDVVTRWNSTLKMYQRAIKDREIISLSTSDQSIASDFIGCVLSPEDWNHIHAMVEWLDTPAEVSTFLDGSKYPTLPIASLAFNCLLEHCNGYLVPTSSSTPTNHTQEIQEAASERCLQYLIKYQENLKSVPSRIAMFLDPGVPIQSNVIERHLDIQLVEDILEAHYDMSNFDVEAPSQSANVQENSVGQSKIWRLVGVHNNNVISDLKLSIT